jgi:HEAT repeat protein
MVKKYKPAILALTVFIISGLVLLSTLSRQIKYNNSEKENNKSVEIDRSNSTPKSSYELNNQSSVNPDKNKSTDYSRKSWDNKNLIETHVKSFAESFYSNNMDELNRSAGSIFKLGQKAIPELLNIISDQSHDPLFRKMAFELVREIGLSPKHVELLTEMARNKSENSIIRGEAVWALGFTGSQDAIDPLIDFLSDKKEENRIRKLAATSLGLLDARQAEPILIETLNNRENSSRVRAASAEALGLINNPLNSEILQDSIHDQSWEVQISSIKALAQFDDESSSSALQKKLIKQIQNEKKDVNDAIVKSTIDSLVLLNSETSVPVLKEILKGKDYYYSALSGKALGELGDPRSIPVILEVLKTANDPFQVRLLEEALKKLNEK